MFHSTQNTSFRKCSSQPVLGNTEETKPHTTKAAFILNTNMLLGAVILLRSTLHIFLQNLIS